MTLKKQTELNRNTSCPEAEKINARRFFATVLEKEIIRNTMESHFLYSSAKHMALVMHTLCDLAQSFRLYIATLGKEIQQEVKSTELSCHLKASLYSPLFSFMCFISHTIHKPNELFVHTVWSTISLKSSYPCVTCCLFWKLRTEILDDLRILKLKKSKLRLEA